MDINEIKTQMMSMANNLHDMLDLIAKGFMENKSEFLSMAMKKEDGINAMQKALTEGVLELSKKTRDANKKKELSTLEQIVETLERMGDEGGSLIERIEMKVAEHLLFSDIGVDQFNETYDAMRKSVEMMMRFLKDRSPELKERVIDNGFHVKELVERYRKEHTERLINGLCTPIAANMYFDMLDFTGNLARHASNIVKLF